MRRLLSVAEVAEYLGIQPKTLMNQRTRRESPGSLGMRIGGAVRRDPDELEEWVSPAAARASAVTMTDWPVLEPVALYGLAGDIVNTLDEYTEADKAAVLFNVLAMFGTFVGPKPRMIVDGSIHTARVFVVVVGNTSRARKSTATAQTRRLFADVDEDWCDDGIRSGFASGEALIKELAEAEDPRCLIVEPEFATVLARAGRDGSILSMTMRNTWDGGAVANRRASGSVIAKDHHVGVIAQTTREELQRQLSATEQANGFANRFLFVAAKRSKHLADAPTPPDELYKDLARRIAAAATKAQGIGVMKRSEDGRLAWEEIYNNIDDDVHGIHGALVARAEAQMLRLQMQYALLDGSSEISMEHVAAARAAWDYCEAVGSVGFRLHDRRPDRRQAVRRTPRSGTRRVDPHRTIQAVRREQDSRPARRCPPPPEPPRPDPEREDPQWCRSPDHQGVRMSSKELTQGRWAERHRQRVKELRHIIQSGDLNDAQKRDAAGDMMWHFEQAARLDSPGRSSRIGTVRDPPTK